MLSLRASCRFQVRTVVVLSLPALGGRGSGKHLSGDRSIATVSRAAYRRAMYTEYLVRVRVSHAHRVPG